jgi:nucleoside-diphosphate-sugar epimerase
MAVFVAGAAGFIGSHLVSSLAHDEIEVLACDNFAPDYDVALKRNNVVSFLSNPNVTFYDCNLLDRASVEKLLGNSRIRAVYLVAGSGCGEPFVPASETDLEREFNYLDAMSELADVRQATLVCCLRSGAHAMQNHLRDVAQKSHSNVCIASPDIVYGQGMRPDGLLSRLFRGEPLPDNLPEDDRVKLDEVKSFVRSLRRLAGSKMQEGDEQLEEMLGERSLCCWDGHMGPDVSLREVADFVARLRRGESLSESDSRGKGWQLEEIPALRLGLKETYLQHTAATQSLLC